MAAALVLFVTAFPAAAACCAPMPSSDAAMHAAMPCCGETCQVTKPATSRAPEIALTSNPSPAAPVAFVMTDAAPAASAPPTRVAAHERVSTELAAPPPFLLHRQFRI